MKIILAGNTLADSSAGVYVAGLRVDGLRVVDAADILRSPSKRFFLRGNASHTLAFSVRIEFDSHVEAQKAALTAHSYTLPSGVLEIQCGEHGETGESVFSDNCVLSGMSAVADGVSVVLAYSLTCGLLSTDEPPGFLTPGETMIQAGIETISPGTNSVPIVFPIEFPGVGPVVVTASILIPSGQPLVSGEPSEPSIGPTGFTQLLDALTPGSGYKVSWTAIQMS